MLFMLRIKLMILLRKAGTGRVAKNKYLSKIFFSDPVFFMLRKLFSSQEIKKISYMGQSIYFRGTDDSVYTFSKIKSPSKTDVFFRDLVKPGMKVVDVGAHVGRLTLIAAGKVGPGGTIYSFEPEPRNFSMLTRNIKANGYGNVVAVNKALTNGDKKIRLFLDPDPTASGTHSIFQLKKGMRQAYVEVEGTSVDNFFGKKKIDLVKIDSEGAEPLVLEGMKRVLRHNRRVKIFMEFNPGNLRRAGRDPEDILKLLKSFKFKAYAVDEKHPKPYAVNKQLVDRLKKTNESVELYCTAG